METCIRFRDFEVLHDYFEVDIEVDIEVTLK